MYIVIIARIKLFKVYPIINSSKNLSTSKYGALCP